MSALRTRLDPGFAIIIIIIIITIIIITIIIIIIFRYYIKYFLGEMGCVDPWKMVWDRDFVFVIALNNTEHNL